MRILLVEDERTISRLIRQVLTGMDHEVTAVEAARDAIALLLEREFELVLLDLNLADGDGLRVVDELAASSRPLPPVVLMTGEQSAVEDDPRAASAAAILSKPFAIGDLEAIIGHFAS